MMAKVSSSIKSADERFAVEQWFDRNRPRGRSIDLAPAFRYLVSSLLVLVIMSASGGVLIRSEPGACCSKFALDPSSQSSSAKLRMPVEGRPSVHAESRPDLSTPLIESSLPLFSASEASALGGSAFSLSSHYEGFGLSLGSAAKRDWSADALARTPASRLRQ